MYRGGRKPGTKNRDLKLFAVAYAREARAASFCFERTLVELCQHTDPNVQLRALAIVAGLLHAKPVAIAIPIASDMQLSFLPAEPEPAGNVYDGETLQ